MFSANISTLLMSNAVAGDGTGTGTLRYRWRGTRSPKSNDEQCNFACIQP